MKAVGMRVSRQQRLRVLMLTFSALDYVHDLAQELGQVCDLTVAWPKETEAPGDASTRRYELVELPNSGSRVLRNLLWLWAIRKLIRKLKPDLLHVQISNPAVSALLLAEKIPVVLTIHDPETHPGEANLRSRLGQWLQRRSADWYVAHGPWSRDLLERAGFDPARIAVHEHGPLLSYGDPAEYRPSEGATVLFFGRIHQYKGLEVLLEAVSLMGPQPRVIIAGAGNREYLEECLARSAVRPDVRYGYVSRPAVRELFDEATLVCLPYTSASQSGVLGIAKALGRAVVASRTGDLPYAVNAPKHGLLVPPGDARALAERLTELLTDAELRHRMEANSLEYSNSGPWRTAAIDLESKYREWLSGRESPGREWAVSR